MHTIFGRDPPISSRESYFRFSKTNGRHIGFLCLVSILTVSSSSACHCASDYQISFKLDYRQQSYDVIAIFKVAAVHLVIFGVAI